MFKHLKPSSKHFPNISKNIENDQASSKSLHPKASNFKFNFFWEILLILSFSNFPVVDQDLQPLFSLSQEPRQISVTSATSEERFEEALFFFFFDALRCRNLCFFFGTTWTIHGKTPGFTFLCLILNSCGRLVVVNRIWLQVAHDICISAYFSLLCPLAMFHDYCGICSQASSTRAIIFKEKSQLEDFLFRKGRRPNCGTWKRKQSRWRVGAMWQVVATFSTPIPGELIQFDGWRLFKWVGKNHQLVRIYRKCNLYWDAARIFLSSLI